MLIMKRKKIIFIGFLSLFLSIGTYFYFDVYKEYKFKSKIGDILGAISGMENWIRFSPETENFSILFPKQPLSQTHAIPIPGSTNVLTYEEHSLESKSYGFFSVSHMTLPQKWTKWGASLTLKGAFKLIMQRVKYTKILGKQSSNFKGLPSLDYEYHSAKTHSIGKLILVKNTLYRVEMTFPLDAEEAIKEKGSFFIRSFEIRNES